MFVLWIGSFVQVFVIIKCDYIEITTGLNHNTTVAATASALRKRDLLMTLTMPYSKLRDIIEHIRDLLKEMDQKVAAQVKGISDKDIIKSNDLRTNAMTASELIYNKLKPINFRQKQHMGYCHAIIDGLIDAIVDKQDTSLKLLIDAIIKTIKRLLSNGELENLSDLLKSRVKSFYIWMSGLPVKTLKEKARNVQVVLRNLDADLLQIFTEYDAYFTTDQGKRLLNKIEELHKINNSADPVTVQALTDSILRTFIAPVNKMRDSFKLKSLLSKINKAYQRYTKTRRSEIEALFNNLTDYESEILSGTLPIRQKSSRQDSKYTNLKKLKKQTTTFIQIDKYIDTNIIKHKNSQNKNEHYYKSSDIRKKNSYDLNQKRKQAGITRTVTPSLRKRYSSFLLGSEIIKQTVQNNKKHALSTFNSKRKILTNVKNKFSRINTVFTDSSNYDSDEERYLKDKLNHALR